MDIVILIKGDDRFDYINERLEKHNLVSFKGDLVTPQNIIDAMTEMVDELDRKQEIIDKLESEPDKNDDDNHLFEREV